MDYRRTDIPGHNNTSTQMMQSETHLPRSGEEGRLTIGRDVILSGEISNCSDLRVDGQIKAVLKDGTYVEVSETGRFEGTLETVDAEISGVFEGELTVAHRLILRPSAHVKGTLTYGMLEVHPGAQIEGQMTSIPIPEAEPAVETHVQNLDLNAQNAEDAASFDMQTIIERISDDDVQDDDTQTRFQSVANG